MPVVFNFQASSGFVISLAQMALSRCEGSNAYAVCACACIYHQEETGIKAPWLVVSVPKEWQKNGGKDQGKKRQRKEEEWEDKHVERGMWGTLAEWNYWRKMKEQIRKQTDSHGENQRQIGAEKGENIKKR